MTEVEALLRAGRPIREIYCSERFAESAKGLEFLKTRNEDGRISMILGSEAFAKASYQKQLGGRACGCGMLESRFACRSPFPEFGPGSRRDRETRKHGCDSTDRRGFWRLQHSPLGTGFGFFQPQRRPFFPGLMARLQVSVGTKEEVSTWLEQAGLRSSARVLSLQSPTGICS